MEPKSQVLSEGWILGTAPWNVCLFLSYPEISVETWTNVVTLYWTLLKIFYGFTIVKNSCEGVRTLISIGLWKEYSQIKLRSQRWRILETIFYLLPAYPESFNLVSFKFVKVTQLCLTLCDPYRLYSPWNSPGQNTGVGSLSLLQGIFPTQGSNPGLPHCRWILYQLSHKGSPRILEWVAYPFSSRSSQPRSQTGVSSLQVDSLPTELSGEPPVSSLILNTFSVVFYLTNWGLGSGTDRRVEDIGPGLALLLSEAVCSAGILNSVSQQKNQDI